jgi:magnesium-transporting ATPase (P-type)
MDTLGGLAFAGEAPLPYYMREKPKRRDEPILNKEILNHIIICGAYTLLLCTFFLVFGAFRGLYVTDNEFYTAFYALFIFAGIFNCLLARCERLNILSNIGKNKIFVFIMLLISIIQIFMIYYGGAVFRCVPLTAKELSFVILFAASVIPFDLIRRIVYKLK